MTTQAEANKFNAERVLKLEKKLEDLERNYLFLEDMLTCPTCVKCNARLSKQDGRGWEKLQENLWLCPECIYKTQACIDLKDGAVKPIPYDKLWVDIMKNAVYEEEHGISATVDTYTLRKILEKHKILPKTKDGM